MGAVHLSTLRSDTPSPLESSAQENLECRSDGRKESVCHVPSSDTGFVTSGCITYFRTPEFIMSDPFWPLVSSVLRNNLRYFCKVFVQLSL
jgi:hypothetical protein